MNFWIGAYWSKGPRKENEDSLLVEEASTLRGRVLFMAVADGIGGLQEGEVASGYICERLSQAFFDRIIPEINKGSGLGALKKIVMRTLYETVRELKEYGRSKEISLGSTLSCVLIVGRRYITFQSGDSKVIRCRSKNKDLTTLDVNSDGSINKCIGSFEYVKPSVGSGILLKNTGILICSDGFWKRFPMDTELLNPRSIENRDQIEKRLSSMARQLRKNGEKDNISAIYAKCI